MAAKKRLNTNATVSEPSPAPDPEPVAPADEPAHRAFVDSAAIALYANGWPDKTVFMKAELLWALRTRHLKGQP